MVWKHVLCENIRYQFDISSLDFVVNRFFMKLFQTNNIDIVNYCRAQFKYFDLPSTVVEKRIVRSLLQNIDHVKMLHVNLRYLFHCCYFFSFLCWFLQFFLFSVLWWIKMYIRWRSRYCTPETDTKHSAASLRQQSCLFKLSIRQLLYLHACR